MEHILIIGATGQIGSELTMELRKRYGNANVVAGYIPGAEPKGELKESGPSAIADVTDGEAIASVVKEYHIDTIYNLAALLSVVAESKPKLAWKIGMCCPFSGHYFECDPSGRRYDRLCCRYLLLGSERRKICVPH